MKIYVAGHKGMVGSAITRRLQGLGYNNLVLRTHAELELTDQRAVRDFMREERPDFVFLAAAKVGGIVANNTYRADFIYQNLIVQANVIHSAFEAGVRRMLFLGSSCIYPRDCPQPIKEEYLLSGPLEMTNRPYAVAKIAGMEMCDSYNRQHGTQYISVMPTNLYGPNDNYDPQNCHVLPALIRKVHEAKTRGDNKLVVWGTGKPRREFLHVDDMANACVFLMEKGVSDGYFNVGTGIDLTIGELAGLVLRAADFDAELMFDDTKPDGTPRKLLDVSRMRALGWAPCIDLADGVRLVYQEYAARAGN